jgi:pimeloyl-ACP methyl ester carboxylesterase
MEFCPSDRRAPRHVVEIEGWRYEYAVFENEIENEIEIEDGIEIEGGDGVRRRTVVALHGFARCVEDWAVVAEAWPEPVRIVAVHLPHHGASGPVDPALPEDAAVTPEALSRALLQVAEQAGAGGSTVDLVGYSIGGRVAFAVLVADPMRWGRVVLLAPDGLRKSPFYDVTVNGRWGGWIWRAIDRRAERVLHISDQLLQLRLISKHLHGFGRFHLETAEMRRMVWLGWRAHRLCWPRVAEIRAALALHPGPVDLVFGDRDRIIPPRNGRTLQRRTAGLGHVHFHTVPSGHVMLKRDVLAAVFARIFPG